MKQRDFFNLNLPKWPALVVVGKPVTGEQAAEIIIRTDSMHFSCNEWEFKRQLHAAFYDIEISDRSYGSEERAIKQKLGLDPDDRSSWNVYWDHTEKVKMETGQIDLEYLNNDQVVSSWFGGPHGWCDWQGRIGCWNYNIGKWPSVETVFREWQRIAKAFPFLDLTCQLMNHEVDCEEYVDDIPGPVVEFRVKSGRVTMKEPRSVLQRPSHGDESQFMKVFMRGGERGCTIDQFKRAVDGCRAKFKASEEAASC